MFVGATAQTWVAGKPSLAGPYQSPSRGGRVARTEATTCTGADAAANADKTFCVFDGDKCKAKSLIWCLGEGITVFTFFLK